MYRAQELLETELDKFTNSAASAAMVSDAIFTSNTPSVELIDRMSHQDFSQSIGSEEFSQLRIKSRIAEFIRAFKMQIFTEAKLYFEAMDGVIEQGDAYFLPQAPSTTIDESSDNIVESDVTTSEAASRQQYASAIGFQSREAVRLTFQYSYIHSVKQPRDELKGLKSRSAFSSNRNRRTRREPTVDTNKTTQTSAPTNDKAIPIILSFFEKLHKAATFTNLLIIAILSVGAYFLFNKKEAKTALLRLDDISTLDWIEGCSTKKKSPQSNPMKGKDKDKKVKAIEDKRIRNRSTSSVPAICVSSSRDNSNLTMLVPRPSTENFTTQNASPHTTNTSSDAKPVSVNLSASSNHSSVIPSDIPLFESQNDISDSQNPKSMKISPSMETLLPHLQVEDQIAAENEGEWTALPSGGAVKSKHLKASEKKLGKVAQRGKTVSEYPLKQQLEMKHLDTSASVSATATTYINGNKPTNTMKGNAKPSVASKSNTNSSSGKQSASAQPRGTNNNTSLAIPTTTGDVVESSSNEASPKANVWAARRRASKEDANITGSIPHPLNGIPKKVTTKSLHSTDGEDITSESDSISSVTGGEQNYFNKRVENDLNQHDSAQQYHQQMIHHQQMQQQYQQHMMNQSAMLHQPHTAVLAQTTDMYGNVTNQNYIIFAPEVVYENVPIGMPSTGAYPGPFQQTASGLPSSSASVPDAVSASSHDVSDPGASGYSTSPQFYYCPSSVPIYDGQGGMASHMNTSINQVAYAYPFYPQQPQQGMPQSQTNTQSVSVPASPQRIATPRSSNGEISQYSPESLARLQQQQQQSQSVTIEDHLLLVQAIRVQIEYYFSIANLSRDYYLRGVMDDEGYVALGEINNFRRIRNMYANAHLMMEAIISSTQLEVLKNDVVDSVLANPSCLMTLSEQAIFETKIRSVHDKSLWNVPVVADENMNVGCSSPPI